MRSSCATTPTWTTNRSRPRCRSLPERWARRSTQHTRRSDGCCRRSSGAAADGVERLTAFGSGGQDLSVPLRDNPFAARVAITEFPIRLVGYDKRGRFAAVQTLQSRLLGGVLPASAWTPSRRTIRVHGPNGATATLRVTHGTNMIRCWRLRFSTGESLTMRPVADLYVFAIPREYLRTERQLAFVRGYEAHGIVVQRAPVLFKLRSGSGRISVPRRAPARPRRSCRAGSRRSSAPP
jgi:hypothetical protein